MVYKFMPPMARPRLRHANPIWLNKMEVIKATFRSYSATLNCITTTNEIDGVFWLARYCGRFGWLRKADVARFVFMNLFGSKCLGFVPGHYARWKHVYRADNPNYDTFAIKR